MVRSLFEPTKLLLFAWDSKPGGSEERSREVKTIGFAENMEPSD